MKANRDLNNPDKETVSAKFVEDLVTYAMAHSRSGVLSPISEFVSVLITVSVVDGMMVGSKYFDLNSCW